jgi:hypothetical protein
MTALINIHFESDLFQFVIKENRITRVTKFCGDSQFMREMLFEDLSEEVRRLLVEELNNQYNQ